MGTTFRHSGDLGDIIYALPAMKSLGGGILYLNPGKPLPEPIEGIPTKKFTGKKPVDMIRPLLKAQPYISDVRVWDGECVEYDLDQFRNRGLDLSVTNLAAAYCHVFNIDEKVVGDQWLFNVKPKRLGRRTVVFHRSPRYHNAEFEEKSWPMYVGEYRRNAVFVGVRSEYKDFVERFGCRDIPFRKVSDFLELARIIKASELFVGNQSLPFAISEGLHAHTVLECSTSHRNCIFVRNPSNEVLQGGVE